jgi:2-phosphosulfolactate phosphatase
MAVKVKGFDFGNSPLEYTSDKIQNRTVLLSITNGTRAIEKAMGAKLILAASFLNLRTVVDYMADLNEDFTLLCSGTNGNFSLDDGLCAGLIIHELRRRKALITTDFGELLSLVFRKNEFSLTGSLGSAFHLALLKRKGHQDNVDYQ